MKKFTIIAVALLLPMMVWGQAQIDTKKKPLDGRSLIIHGTLDTVVPPSHVLEYCSAHPKVRLHLMEGADHRFKNAGELDCICDTAINFIYN